MKKLAMICALAMVLTMIAPFAAVSAATDTNGVLYWDFETTDDVAGPLKASAAWETAENPDLIGTGAWNRQIAARGPVFGHPWLCSFDKLYLADGNAAWNLITQAETDANFSSLPLANGGEKCIAMYSADGGKGPVAFGPVIQLEDTKLIPGVTYTVEFDALTSSAYPRSIYAGFSKPSERTSGAMDAAASYPWFVEGNVRQAKVNDEVKYAVNTEWRHMTAEVTPSADKYENGSILFYIAAGNLDDKSTANAKEWLYLDNIKLTPKNLVTDKPAYTKFNYGKIWDFENDYHVNATSGNYEMDSGIPGNASGGNMDMYPTTFENGDWSLFSSVTADSWFKGPRIRKVSEAVLCTNSMSDTSLNKTTDGHDGAAAPGSEYCARVRVHSGNNKWTVGVLGMRVKLTKDEFPAGDYTFTTYAGYTTNILAKVDLYASVFAGDKLIIDQDTGLNTGDTTVVAGSFDDAVIKQQLMGRLGTHWGKYTTTLSLTNECFDENGVATLMLHTGFGQQAGTQMLYFDDISLVLDTDMIPSSGVLGFVTTASYTDVEDAMIAAGLYYDQDASYLIDADSIKGDIGRVTHSNIKLDMVGDAYDEGWPTAKIYMFDKFFAPILDTPLTFE